MTHLYDHCPKCGARTIWESRVEGSDSKFEAACPNCLLHIRVHNGHIELTRPNDRVKPEPRKPREWWAEVYSDGSGRLYSDTRSLTKGCGEIIRVTEQLQPDKVWCS